MPNEQENLDAEHLLMATAQNTEAINNLEPSLEGILLKSDEIAKNTKPKEIQKVEIIQPEVEDDEDKLANVFYSMLRGKKGEKGDKHTDEELVALIEPLIPAPIKGDKGEDGDDGYTPIKGIDYFDGKDGKDGTDGKDGEDGKDADIELIVAQVVKKIPKSQKSKDGSPDTPKQVKEKLLKEGISYDEIKDAPDIDKIARISGQASKTVSLKELDDVDVSQATISNGKYVIPAVGAGSGDVTGPATNTDSYIPQWDGANSKTLKNGIPTSTFEPAKGADDNYVTDAQLVVIGNTSGTNTGDQNLSGLVPYTGATTDVDLGTHTFTANGIASKAGGLFAGQVSPFPTGYGTYVANYVSSTYGARSLAFDGTNYHDYFLGKLISGSTFQLALKADGTSVFGGSVSATNLSGTNTGDETQATIKTKLGAASAGVDGYLTGADWTTFNAKQNALTNPVTGTGTTNELSYWTSSSTQGTLPVSTYPSLTETSYVKGVTSAIQTQLNAKAGLTSPSFITSVIGSATMAVFNTISTVISAFGAATTLTIGGTPTTAITHNYSTNATATATTKTVNIATGGASGSTTNINLGTSTGTTVTTNNGKLLVAKGTTTDFDASKTTGSINNYLQNNIQNTSTGTSASSDFVATADNGSETTNFIDVGINSSTYSDAAYNINGADGAYIYNAGSDLSIGTATATKTIKFHTGGTTSSQLRATLSDTGLAMSTGLKVTASQIITTPKAVTVATNAASTDVLYRTNDITNNAAGAVTITLPTTGAVNGMMCMVRFYDYSAVAQTITWVNTENDVTPFGTSRGSTTIPKTAGFIYNGVTSKWTCLASS